MMAGIFRKDFLGLLAAVFFVVLLVVGVVGLQESQEPLEQYMWFFDEPRTLTWLVSNSWTCETYYEYQYPYYGCRTSDEYFQSILLTFDASGQATWMLFTPRSGLTVGDVVASLGRWTDALIGPRKGNSPRRIVLRWPEAMIILFERNFLTLQSEVSSIHLYVRDSNAS